jgi:hypothetical protein
MLRVMRSNYDKAWRCPQWSGPALRVGGGDCPSGSFAQAWSTKRHPEWRMLQCQKCGTWALPNVLKWLDPSWLRSWAWWRIREWKYERKMERFK